MNLFVLLSALTLPVRVDAFTDAMPPKREPWELLLNSRVVVTEREKILRLATYMPKLYGFRFVCQFQSASKAAPPACVLPGEWVDPGEGGTLHCPDHFDVYVEKGAKLRVTQAGDLPRFVLEDGRITISTRQEGFFVESPAFRLSAVGESALQSLTVDARANSNQLYCDHGAFAMSFENLSAPGRHMLSSRDCQLDLELAGGKARRYLHAFDEIEVANLSLPHKFWPKRAAPPPVAPGENTLVGLQLNYIPSAKLDSPLHVNWLIQRNFAVQPKEVHCSVQGSRAEGEPFKEISKFVGAGISGSVDVDPAYRNGFLTLVCDTETISLASNVLDIEEIRRAIPAR